jgi:hypothetical protein
MTAEGPDTAALRRESARELLDQWPVVMVGDAAAELDVSTTTARRYLEQLEEQNPAVQSRQASGGRIWYLQDVATDGGGVASLAEVEHHFRRLWSDCGAGQALVVGLALTLIIMLLSTVSLAADTAGWQALYARTRTVVHLLSVVCFAELVGSAWVLWRQGRLRP